MDQNTTSTLQLPSEAILNFTTHISYSIPHTSHSIPHTPCSQTQLSCFKFHALLICSHLVHRIQSVWRGYRVRKWLEEYRERHPPHHPILRAKHYRKKLTCLTTELVESVNSTTEKANNLLARLDYDLEESRKAMRHVIVKNGLIYTYTHTCTILKYKDVYV